MRHLPSTPLRAWILASAVLASCTDAAPHRARSFRAVDGSTGTSPDGAALDGEVDSAPPLELPPALTPGASLDFLSPTPPTVSLTPVVTFTRPDLPDKSVDPPAAHDAVVVSDIEAMPGDAGEFLLALSSGLIIWLDRDMIVKGTFQVASSNSLASYRARGSKYLDNEGLLGIAFDREFERNGYLYVHVVPEAYTGVEVWRLRWKPDALDEIWSGGTRLLRIDKPQVAASQAYLQNHNGGNLSMGPDGMLYVAVGDGGVGGGMDPSENLAQSLASYWGKLLRLDPAGVQAPEIVAHGLRNPFTHVWRGNELYLGDVGSDVATIRLFSSRTRT